MWALPYCLPHAVLLLSAWSQSSSEPFVQCLPLVVVWFVFPILDGLAGVWHTSGKLSNEKRKTIEHRWSFRLVVLAWAPMQLAFLVWSCARVSNESLGFFSQIMLAMSMGLIAAGGINVAHELFHRRNAFERAVGELLLISVWYGHFVIEHTKGHHKNVATPLDPATMRFGESFYSFLPRTIAGGFKSAWRIESTRLRNNRIPAWSVRNNHVIRYVLSSTAVTIILTLLLGIRACVFFLAQSFLAITLLEQVNAIEHYGLLRRKTETGYEPVGERHSWDACDRLSNYLLFKLQNHADHHLRTFQISPTSSLEF